ncbi:hypothetical protein STCU_03853 [Strigomonas culicis]|uniref:Uncharacterized protein n=1 Tax=Strigomonas culicis TaxID=28005 RepID=S9W4P4_9TRYP|nr:hypothetical protein STCU_03853 [Strigomonas culicis]|eukprot:EPY30850.1 hypothetical protein STCU_03853 [Strigomonas culicis]
MPEYLKERANYHFYEKQWESVASFWMNRVLKEIPLQHLAVEDVINLIEEDIEKRWKAKRSDQSLYKKRKRLLGSDEPAGHPSRCVLLTNVIKLSDYVQSSEADKKEFLSSIVDYVEAKAKETSTDIRVLLSSDADMDNNEASEKRKRIDTTGSDGVTRARGGGASDTNEFDDHLAVVCTLSSKEKAATVIAQVHKSVFNGRTVVCRFGFEELQPV